MIDKVRDACTGCSACYSICPVDAIRMEADVEGFLQPIIDMTQCTHCGLCEIVCPSLKSCKKLNTQTPRVFAAWTKDTELRINSTSGGVFSELAKEILSRGGHVVGARYKPDHTVEHCVIRDLIELPFLRQSKYLQSELGHTFKAVEESLNTGVQVLFCGTPCFVAGLLNYLRRNYDNLTVCDFICRGVSSPMVYKMYLTDLEKEYGAPVKTVQFKNKNIGWNQFCTFIRFKNGKTYQKDRYQDAYMYGYLMKNLYLRSSCYACLFKEIPRIADISLGDFWGIGDTRSHLDENKGTSLVFVNTTKGMDLFSAVKEQLVVEECTLDEALAGNLHILESASKPQDRAQFFYQLFRSRSFLETMAPYQRTHGIMTFKNKALSMMRWMMGWMQNKRRYG